jgi:hypothetical protein
MKYIAGRRKEKEQCIYRRKQNQPPCKQQKSTARQCVALHSLQAWEEGIRRWITQHSISPNEWAAWEGMQGNSNRHAQPPYLPAKCSRNAGTAS